MAINYIMAGSSGKVLTSEDGNTWNLITPSSIDFYYSGVCDNTFILVPYTSSGIIYSNDGINWTPSTFTINETVKGFFVINNRAYLLTVSGSRSTYRLKCYQSTDSGNSFVLQDTITYTNANYAIYLGNGNSDVYMDDIYYGWAYWTDVKFIYKFNTTSLLFETLSLNVPSTVNMGTNSRVYANNNGIIFCGTFNTSYSNKGYKSADLLTWEVMNSVDIVQSQQAVYTTSNTIMCSISGAFNITDNLEIPNKSFPYMSTYSIIDYKYINNIYFAVEWDGHLLVSNDGTTWVEKTIESGMITIAGKIVYTNNITVKSNDGSVIYGELQGVPDMTSVNITELGKSKTATFTGVNSETYTISWDSTPPAGMTFLGLATQENAKNASISTQATTPVNITSSIVLYEVNNIYRPPLTPFYINTYRNSAEQIQVDKTNSLMPVDSIGGVLRDNCDVINPSVVIEYDTIPTFNYIYIPAFARYYFVTGITAMSKNLWKIDAKCDVLMTYKDVIKSQTGIIARQQNDYNDDLIDSEIPAEKGNDIEIVEINNTIFTNQAEENAHTFVLNVVGA